MEDNVHRLVDVDVLDAVVVAKIERLAA